MTVDLSSQISVASTPSQAFTDDYRPIRPPVEDFLLRVVTYQDMMEQLYITFDIKESSHKKRARTAVDNAYQDLHNRHNWPYYERVGSITTVAAQSTGTVAYDATSRELTLSGATWPTNARFMSLIVNQQICEVESRSSDTVVILRANKSPTSDIAAGASYSIYRDIYPLPIDLQKVGPLQPVTDSYWPSFALPDRLLEQKLHNYSPQSNPNLYTVRHSRDFMGGLCIEFSPPPLTAETFDFCYTAKPRPLQTFGASTEYSTGTITSSGVTVTGSGTTFTGSMVGCILRIAANGSAPTGKMGSYAVDNPYSEQRVIQTVNSSTELTIDRAFTDEPSGASYTIGAPVDLDYDTMLTAFRRCCEATFALESLRDDADLWRQRYINELKNAMAACNPRTSVNSSSQIGISLSDLGQEDL